MRKGRWSLKFKAGLYVGFFTIFFIITLMVAVWLPSASALNATIIP